MAGIMTVTESTTGRNIYTVIVNSSGLYYKGSGLFEAYNAAHWANYAVAMAESPSKVYTAAFPASITTADAYSLYSYYQSGGSPATTDANAGFGDMQWSGSGELPSGGGGGLGAITSMFIGV